MSPQPSLPLISPAPPDPLPLRPARSDTVGLAIVAGAQILRLHEVLRMEALVAGAVVDRLVLRSTCRASAESGREESLQSLRDLWHGADAIGPLGPSGEVLRALRHLYGRPPRDAVDDLPRALAEIVSNEVGEALARDLRDAPAREADILARPVSCFTAAREAAPEAPLLPAIVGDLALAFSLRLRTTLPILTLGLERPRTRLDGEDLVRALLDGIRRGGDVLLREYRAFEAAARALALARPKLRARGVDHAIAALLENESVYPPRLSRVIGDRAGRRLFDRLTALGLVVETTGRSYFRIYSLVPDAEARS